MYIAVSKCISDSTHDGLTWEIPFTRLCVSNVTVAMYSTLTHAKDYNTGKRRVDYKLW